MWDESIPLTELSHDGFKAWIEIDGTPSRLYLPNCARSTAKLEATGGKEFTICWKNTTKTGRDFASSIMLDSSGPFEGPVLSTRGSGVICKSGMAATRHTVWPFTFVENNVEDNSHQTGVIKLQLHIVRRLIQRQPRLSPDQPSLKSRQERLAAGFGPLREGDCTHNVQINSYELVVPSEIVTFEFHYRSRNFLISELGLEHLLPTLPKHPVQPSPAPSSMHTTGRKRSLEDVSNLPAPKRYKTISSAMPESTTCDVGSSAQYQLPGPPKHNSQYAPSAREGYHTGYDSSMNVAPASVPSLAAPIPGNGYRTRDAATLAGAHNNNRSLLPHISHIAASINPADSSSHKPMYAQPLQYSPRQDPYATQTTWTPNQYANPSTGYTQGSLGTIHPDSTVYPPQPPLQPVRASEAAQGYWNPHPAPGTLHNMQPYNSVAVRNDTTTAQHDTGAYALPQGQQSHARPLYALQAPEPAAYQHTSTFLLFTELLKVIESDAPLDLHAAYTILDQANLGENNQPHSAPTVDERPPRPLTSLPSDGQYGQAAHAQIANTWGNDSIAEFSFETHTGYQAYPAGNGTENTQR